MFQLLPAIGREMGICRRSFLTAGAIGGGLSLVKLLRAEAAAGIGKSHKAVINIHLDGGPPQMDMIDPKPDAPAELRGEFRPISTRVPGSKCGRSRCTSAMYFFRTGDQVLVDA